MNELLNDGLPTDQSVSPVYSGDERLGEVGAPSPSDTVKRGRGGTDPGLVTQQQLWGLVWLPEDPGSAWVAGLPLAGYSLPWTQTVSKACGRKEPDRD